MNSVDPGSLLLQLGQQQSAPPQSAALSDQQILALAQKPSASAATPQQAGPTQQQLAQQYGSYGSWASALPAPLQHFIGGAESAAPYYYDQARKSLKLPQNAPREAAETEATQSLAGKLGQWGASALLGAPIAAAAALAAPEVAGAAGLGAGTAALLGAAGGGAAQGALLSPAGSRGENALIGGLTGGLLHGAGGLGGKVVQGLTRSPQAQALVDKGVNLPPGMLGQSGAGNKIEQALTHLPFLGSRIANARNAVPGQISDLMTQDAVAPGQTLPKGLGINDAVSGLQNGYDAAYNQAVGGYPASAKIMRTTGSDIPLSDAFNSVANTARPGLTAQARASMAQTLQDQLQELIKSGVQSGNGLQATDLQGFRSTLRTLAREAPEGTTQSAVRGFWQDAEDKVTQALESQLPPKSAAALQAIDANYGKFATVRDLAASVKDRTPTMNDWSNAIARNTPKPVYAAGGGWNRNLIQSAANVVKPTVAHTGALGAGTIAPAVAGLEAAMHPAFLMAHPVGGAAVGAGIGGLLGAYSKTGMRALAGQTAPQKAVQGLLQQLSPQMRGLLPLLLKSAGTQAALQGLNSGNLLPAQ